MPKATVDEYGQLVLGKYDIRHPSWLIEHFVVDPITMASSVQLFSNGDFRGRARLPRVPHAQTCGL